MKMYCQNCGTVGNPKNLTKGSFLIELILWLCFLIPGVIYSLWRLSTRAAVCPRCGAPNMIPADSPKARVALAQAPPEVQAAISAPEPPPPDPVPTNYSRKPLLIVMLVFGALALVGLMFEVF